jgi:hypothetical protein
VDGHRTNVSVASRLDNKTCSRFLLRDAILALIVFSDLTSAGLGAIDPPMNAGIFCFHQLAKLSGLPLLVVPVLLGIVYTLYACQCNENRK